MAATQPAGTWATTETEPALLAGLAVCSACGARLTRRSRPHGTGKARTRVLFYRCSSISAVPGVREHGQRLGEAQGTMDVRSSQEGIKGVRGGVIATHGDHDGEVRLLGQQPASRPECRDHSSSHLLRIGKMDQQVSSYRHGIGRQPASMT
jgi:hypothetical protein